MRFRRIFCLAVTVLLFAHTGVPNAPCAVLSVRDFGAVGDGTNKDTGAFQKALDTCAVNGGGEVLVPAGHYLIGSVQMGTRTVLRLEQDSVIVGSADLLDYPMLDVRWEGRWQPGHRALVYAANVDKIGIIGPGRIEGSPAVAAPQNPRGVVILEPVSCHGVIWQDVSVTQGANWALHPTYCAEVVVRNVTINSDRDGIDVDSCRDVRIENCTLGTGDDSISLKSGRGMDGARIGRPTEDVVITNCTLLDRRFACVGIGSETSGGIRNVRVTHCRLTSRTYALYVKSRIGRAGTIENISGDDLDVLGGGFLRVNLISAGNSNTADDPVPGLVGYPLGKEFRFFNIHLTNATVLADATHIAPERPLEGLSMSNITGRCATGISLANITQVELREIHVTGCVGPLVTHTNVHGVGLDDPK